MKTKTKRCIKIKKCRGGSSGSFESRKGISAKHELASRRVELAKRQSAKETAKEKRNAAIAKRQSANTAKETAKEKLNAAIAKRENTKSTAKKLRQNRRLFVMFIARKPQKP